MEFSLTNSFPLATFTHSLDSNDFNGRKTYNLAAEYQISDPLKLIFNNNRDLASGLNLTQSYGFNYISPSKCWMMNLMYLEALNDEQIRFDLPFILGNNQSCERESIFFGLAIRN